MTDPVADMLNRIKNAGVVKKPAVDVPYSDLKYAVVKVLERNGFVKHVEVDKKKGRRMLEIVLKYREDKPAVSGVRKVSKPGQRIYAPAQDIKRVRGGYGVAVISTSKGVMSDKEVRKEGVGGEVICYVW